MRSLSANMLTHLASDTPKLVTCVMVELTDGTRIGFTDWPRTLSVDIGEGAESYLPIGGFKSTAHSSDMGLGADNVTVDGIIDGSRVVRSDLIGGIYDGAQFWAFLVNPDAIADGIIDIDYGRFADIEISDQSWSTDMLSLSTLLEQVVGDKYQRQCRHTLGDANCGIVLLPDVWASGTFSLYDSCRDSSYDARRYVVTAIAGGAASGSSGVSKPTFDTTIGNTTSDGDLTWTTYEAYTKQGSVTGVTDNQVFTDSSRSEAANWFRGGILTFTSGNNAGLAQQVKSFDGSQFTLLHPMPFDVATSDAFTVHAGCNHLLKMPSDVKLTAYTGDCRQKFSPETSGNAANYGGEPETPGALKILGNT